ncbi:hypothetical protein Micbo1qcDRAFT_231288 [Microdochium bolleyi]|uniref:protein disulfide-isomerase n=1 Tax=Microdochium bolleyi TaxID=196109 RepID=A0A136JGB0_9PEZI|nr:hypothetical protein Micbo1qcDRAFT_231288 [Microdochium bolleyi]
MPNVNAANLAVAATALLAALPGAHAGLYAKNSPVVQLSAKNYDQLIAQSNHTSIVEFYAPWCGHCKNLQPAYEKAAKHLEGIAKVAAIDCDADENKSFCGSMGVQGFPTLKTVRPGKGKGGKPIVEDYNGQRTAKAIVDAVSDKINNHVTRITDKDFLKFLAKDDKPKAVLFTEKGTTSSLLKSIAIDFLDVIHIAQARNKETEINEKFNVQKYPTLVLLNPESSEPLVYDGEMKKAPLVKFLSQAGQPNPDPPIKAGKKAPKDKKPSSSKEAKKSSSTEAAAEPSEAPVAEKPAEVVVPALPVLETIDLTSKCLNTKSKTCILAFVPSAHSGATDEVLDVMSKIAHKFSSQNKNLFPFYEVDINANSEVLTTLGLQGNVLILAVNGKRNWWRQYEGELNIPSVEAWVDAIRLNEGQRYKFPEGFIGADAAAAGSSSSTPTKAASETPTETVVIHVEENVDVQIEPETEQEPSLAGTIHAQPTAEESAHDEL